MFTYIRTLKFIFVNGSSHKICLMVLQKDGISDEMFVSGKSWRDVWYSIFQHFNISCHWRRKISILSYLKEGDALHLWKVLVLFCRVKYETLCLVCSVLINSLRWQIDCFLACLGMNKGKVICVNFNMQKNKISQCPVVPSHSSFLI